MLDAFFSCFLAAWFLLCFIWSWVAQFWWQCKLGHYRYLLCGQNLSIIENDAHNIVNASHCLFTSLLGVGVPNQGAGDNISVSNPFDDVAPGQSQRPNSYGPPYGHSGGPPRPQGTSLLVCLLTPLVHISCHFNCSHVHFSIVFLAFNTLNELLVLCLCWLVWSIFIGCVCGRGPVVVSDLCDPVR